MKIGFDNDKYLKMQSEHIRERINQFGNKLYMEFGGKLFDDYHASRVLPGFAPDSKLRMLMQLSDQAEIVIVISAGDIEKNKGLNPEMDFSTEVIESNGGNGVTDNTAVARYLNKYKNYFGKSRIVVIKSQLGQPIVAFSGDDVYWEIPEDLPKMTKLMIDGKALYIHRANYQIIDRSLLK